MHNDLTGAALYRHEKRVKAIKALEDLGPQDIATICAAFLDEISAGSPRLDTWGDIRSDAAFWADCANVAELEAYFAAILKRLGNQALGIYARKRLFVQFWNGFALPDQKRLYMGQWASFSDADQKAFSARVAPSEVAA